MLKLYRICRKIYNPEDPSGAEKIRGRWHKPRQRVLYFSSSLALCILELKANSVSFETIRREFHYTEIEINPDLILLEEVPESFYIKDWSIDWQLTQNFGEKWYRESRSPLLKVLSAALKSDYNFILNSSHPDFSKIKFPKPKVIPLDPRIK